MRIGVWPAVIRDSHFAGWHLRCSKLACQGDGPSDILWMSEIEKFISLREYFPFLKFYFCIFRFLEIFSFQAMLD
jgi:hypothetical protein